jgi:Domain of unknown function (DUF4328)
LDSPLDADVKFLSDPAGIATGNGMQEKSRGLMEGQAGADSRAMEMAGPAFGHAPHRIADPQDPPREMSGWAWGAIVCLGLIALLSLVKTVVALDLHSVASDGGDIVGAYDSYSTWAGIYGLLLLVAAGVFITWFFRAYRNLRRLGVQNMRYGNGWAVGAWFIPIFGMIRPKQIANDIWRGSERGVDVSHQWRQVEVPSLVHWWWGLFLVQGLLVEIGRRFTESGYSRLTTFGGSVENSISRIETGTTIDVLGSLCAIAAAVLGIMVVNQVSRRLDEIRGDAIAAGQFAPPIPPPPSYPPPPATPMPMPPPPPVISNPPPPPPPPQPAEQRIPCPECAEWIQPQAKICRFCGHRL